MAKRINQLNQTTTITDNDWFAVDSPDASGQTQSITAKDLKDSLTAHCGISISTTTKFETHYYDHQSYIDSGKYTKSYIATQKCLVFWHIEWDCNGTDGLTLEIIDSSKNVKAEITILSDFEGYDSGWMNKNGSIPLNEGMGIRFRAANFLNSAYGNKLTYLVATL